MEVSGFGAVGVGGDSPVLAVVGVGGEFAGRLLNLGVVVFGVPGVRGEVVGRSFRGALVAGGIVGASSGESPFQIVKEVTVHGPA